MLERRNIVGPHDYIEEEWPVRTTALAAGVSVRTVYKWLARYRSEGLSIAPRWRACARTPCNPPPIVRYECEFPGELVHLDIKKLEAL